MNEEEDGGDTFLTGMNKRPRAGSKASSTKKQGGKAAADNEQDEDDEVDSDEY